MKAVLFDWDGVLIDSTYMYYDLYCQLCQKYGKYLPINSLEEFREWYNPAWENNYFEMGFTPEELPMIASFINHGTNYAPLKLYPGVPETLSDLHRDYRLAIVSTTPRDTILKRLQASALDSYIDYITGDDGVSDKVGKIARTLEILECSQAVMIGDTPLDIASGKANKLPTIGASYGWVTPQRVRAAEPSIVIDSALELNSAIRSLLA
ncbi:HAD family hydrolase [bacterium]|nr:HAD family hydrolase [bacterium]